MTDFPDDVYIGKNRNDRYVVFEAESSSEQKYHHDRVVIALQERNARLVEALEEIASYNLEWAYGLDINIEKIKDVCEQALAENKE